MQSDAVSDLFLSNYINKSEQMVYWTVNLYKDLSSAKRMKKKFARSKLKSLQRLIDCFINLKIYSGQQKS